jgi:hypothetical protein
MCHLLLLDYKVKEACIYTNLMTEIIEAVQFKCYTCATIAGCIDWSTGPRTLESAFL